jgi:hypothetical protein
LKQGGHPPACPFSVPKFIEPAVGIAEEQESQQVRNVFTFFASGQQRSGHKPTPSRVAELSRLAK